MEKSTTQHINHTPSEFYRTIRPEYFSDSEVSYDVVLPKEQLEFELSKITTNQKEAEFETLCRRLIEKTIAPNLIPQVGPTGGGDGKTDSETYPVSGYISERWFVPEHGWRKDEKWAFAFSAKQDWKPKATSDVEKILLTNRGYTKIFFVTNQTPSSKQKKDFQDECFKNKNIEVTILDGKWIVEKIYNDNLMDIAVDSLNLSDVYKNKKVVIGKNDIEKNKRLEELEQNITNPDRYFEYDFQLIEDVIESAILSRQLEKPRSEVEGKFDRALRFCEKLKSKKHFIRVYYQKAWTNLYYYDDYQNFINNYLEFKKLISNQSAIYEIELYYNLFNSLQGVCNANCNLSDFNIDIKQERQTILLLLEDISENKDMLCSALIAKAFKMFIVIMESLFEKAMPDKYFLELSDLLKQSIGYIDFPFDSFRISIEKIGELVPNNSDFDKLLDTVATINEKRTSEISTGHIFLKRGGQKLIAGYDKESIIYFGKAVLKLSKEEHKYEMTLAMRGLGWAYEKMGLIWASNNCYTTAASIEIRKWYQSGEITIQLYDCVRNLVQNETRIGRIPQILNWYELLNVIYPQVQTQKEEIKGLDLIDGCLSVRMLNTDIQQDDKFSFLPDILKKHCLWLSENALLYKLGYCSEILPDYEKVNIKTIDDLDKYFDLCANQPFTEQMLYGTNLLANNSIQIQSKILGCIFSISFENDIELLLVAETLLAFFESFLATSLQSAYASAEQIKIHLMRDEHEKIFNFQYNDTKDEYQLKINRFNYAIELREELHIKFMELVAHILSKNFCLKDGIETLENLFKNEEVHERQSFVFEHRNFTMNILGDKPKLFYDSWKADENIQYPNKRTAPLIYNSKKERNLDEKQQSSKLDFNNAKHTDIQAFSIIDNSLWDNAKWNGFGIFMDRFDKSQIGLFIAFQDENAGKSIFDKWIQKFGKEDKEDSIKITIIKGVNKDNPFEYRVHITSDVKLDNINHKERYFTVAARFHTMTPNNPQSLNIIETYFKQNTRYLLCPAKMSYNGNQVAQPDIFPENSILKNKIEIINAWEIGLNDITRCVILENDNPIIPDNIKNAPILEVLKNRLQ